MALVRKWLLNLYYDKYSNDKNKALNFIIYVAMKIWLPYSWGHEKGELTRITWLLKSNVQNMHVTNNIV